MKIFIDADGCPVVDVTIRVAKKFNLECVILCDTSHYFERDGAKTITVSKGADSVDFALVNMLEKGDIAVTQDYGLAAMCLSRGACAISQDGMVYNDNNILGLLNQRADFKKLRMSGGRTHCQARRTKQQDENFEAELIKLLG